MHNLRDHLRILERAASVERPQEDVVSWTERRRWKKMDALVDPMLNRAIGEVVQAAAARDELLRTILSFHTDLEVTYILFEGQPTNTLQNWCDSLLVSKYAGRIIEVDGGKVTKSTNTYSQELAEFLRALKATKRELELRNVAVHGSWSTRSGRPDDVRPRPWKDKRLDVEDLYFCQVSKHNKMYHEEPMTIDDVRHVATSIRIKTKMLAIAATALSGPDSAPYFAYWDYNLDGEQ